MILDAIRESGGVAVAVPEERIEPAMRMAISSEGLAFCPETAACVLAAKELARDGRIQPDECVVLFNTGAATKYAEVVSLNLPMIDDPDSVDYTAMGL